MQYITFCSLTTHWTYRVHVLNGYYQLDYWTGTTWFEIDASATEHYVDIPAFIAMQLSQSI